MNINIIKAQAIDGWLTKEELMWLAEQAQTHKLIVEIGSWMGRSTRALADNTEGVVYAVDTWEGNPEHRTLLKNRSGDWLFEQFGHNVEDLLPGPVYKVRPLKSTSKEGANYLGNHYHNRFDMIFIDGARDYESVKADILAWRPLLAEHGLLCGAAFNLDNMGVVAAVRELCPAYKLHARGIWYQS